MGKPAVTVLIPTYNRAQFLPECLDSVLAQTIPPSQVIVINDGSTDNTWEILEPYMGKIEYLEKENGGKSSALNLAMPHVRGDYVWIMDDDDAALPDALETHLEVLESDSGIGFTYTPGYVGKTRPEGGGIEILKLRPVPDVPDDEFFLRYLQGCFFFHDAMLARAACYAAVGGFDPDFIRCQDVEMMLRLARRFRGRRINKPTIVVRLHSGVRGSEEDRFEAQDWIAKSREYEVKIFERLRNELELCDYLPANFRGTTLGPESKRRAYLERMCVAAGRGMFTDMLCDLRLALAQTEGNPPLAHAERRCISGALGHLQPGDKLLSDPEFAKCVRLSCRGRAGKDVMVEMARGLYWRAMAALQDRRYRFFGEIVRGAWRVLHFRGGILALMRKLRELLAAHGLQRWPMRNGQTG